MNWKITGKTFKYLVLSLVLIAIQDALSTHVYAPLALPDIITCFIILILFHANDELTPWIFIFAGLIGIVEAAWMSQRIGLLSMYYICITYPYVFFKSFAQGNVEYILIILAALISKYIIYFVLGNIFGLKGIIDFIFSIEILYHFLATLVVAIIIFLPINAILYRRRERIR